jgi:hypothetical protein
VATGDTIVSPLQFELMGLLLGDTSPYGVNGVTGLDLPSMRTADVGRSADHGVWRGADLSDGRTITLDLTVYGATSAALEAALAALAAIMVPRPAEVPFAFMLPGEGKRFCSVRPRRKAMPLTTDLQFGAPDVALELYASDPRLYDITRQAASVQPTLAAGGFVTVWTSPLTPVGGSNPGMVQVLNAGTFGSRPVITFAGPASGTLTVPSVVNVTQGLTLSFPTLSLNPGDSLVVDLDTRSVVLNGIASRRGSVGPGSTWFELPPNISQSLQFIGTDPSGTATMTVTWRNAWL